MRTKAAIGSLTLSVIASLVLVPAARADVTSPSIKDTGKQYTREKPATSYYGTGTSARLTEASELRMAVEDLIAAGELEQALPKAKKAVQLDPGDPSGHLFLARILTTKFYETKGKIDEKLMAECAREWQMIRYHDADPTEQWEAGQQVKKLMRIAKTLEKEKIRLAREKEDAAAKDGTCTGAGKVAARDTSASGNSENPKDSPDSNTSMKLSARKHFGLF